jgi:hypothetical protein
MGTRGPTSSRRFLPTPCIRALRDLCIHFSLFFNLSMAKDLPGGGTLNLAPYNSMWVYKRRLSFDLQSILKGVAPTLEEECPLPPPLLWVRVVSIVNHIWLCFHRCIM